MVTTTSVPKVRPHARTVGQTIADIQQKLEFLPDHPKGGKQVKGIAFHHGVHFDELAALAIALVKGEKAFPGLDELVARLMKRQGFQFWGNEERDPALVTEQLKLGVLPIGCGGIIDEHQPGLEKLTATKVMAMVLGVEYDPDLEELLREVDKEDHHGSESAFHVARLMKDTVRHEGVYPAIKEGLTAILKRLRTHTKYTGLAIQLYRDWTAATPTPTQRVIVQEIPGPLTKKVVKGEDEEIVRDEQTGRPKTEMVQIKYKLVAIQVPEVMPNNPESPYSEVANAVALMPAAAMAKMFNGQPGDNADIVIIRWLSGQTQFFYKRWGNRQIDFDAVVRIIRGWEMIARKKAKKLEKIPYMNWEDLTAAGYLPEAPCWFCYKVNHQYMYQGQMRERQETLWLFAGSLTHPDVERSLLSLDQLVDATVTALDETKWQDPEECPKGTMCHQADNEGRTCPWRRYGFRRCHQAEMANRTRNRDQHPRSHPQRSDRDNGRSRKPVQGAKPATRTQGEGHLTASVAEVAVTHEGNGS